MTKLRNWNAEQVREARKKAGLTQGEMAEKLGCRLQTVSEWELGCYEPGNAYKRLLSFYFGAKK